jgi:hypothetical protein
MTTTQTLALAALSERGRMTSAELREAVPYFRPSFLERWQSKGIVERDGEHWYVCNRPARANRDMMAALRYAAELAHANGTWRDQFAELARIVW